MKELVSESNPARMGLLRSTLESRGIATYIERDNELDALPLTALTPARLDPVLCVMDESDHALALSILEDYFTNQEGESKVEKICGACGELNPGNFEVCWSCGAALS